MEGNKKDGEVHPSKLIAIKMRQCPIVSPCDNSLCYSPFHATHEKHSNVNEMQTVSDAS